MNVFFWVRGAATGNYIKCLLLGLTNLEVLVVTVGACHGDSGADQEEGLEADPVVDQEGVQVAACEEGHQVDHREGEVVS